MEKASLNCLVLEVTRKCNMGCEHCLRGDSQNIDLSREVIDKVLDSIDMATNVTFTGGEPSLNIEAIKYFREEAIRREIPIQSFFVVTNGKENVMELAVELLQLYSYCVQCSCFSEANDYSGVALSKDRYHDKIDPQNEAILRGLSFFTEEKFMDTNASLIDEGRAYENGLGKRRIDYCDVEFEEWEAGITVDDVIYINVHGDIVSGCDYSYESQSALAIGNVLNDSLVDIIRHQPVCIENIA